MSPQPWSMERRAIKKRQIDKEAERAAKRLGAHSVTIIAFFEDGEYMHMQDGGAAPMPSEELYKHLATAVEINKANDGKDTALS